MRFRIAVALFCAALGSAQAHSWYDAECCSESDCFPIEADAVEAGRDTYVIKMSGEIFYAPGKNPAGARVYRWSQDGNFHRCTPGGLKNSNVSFCLYVPMPSA